MKRTPPKINAEQACQIFLQAAKANMEESHRDGSIVRLPGYGQAVMTGDLHGHAKNLEKLQRYAMLDRVPARHVILHEIVHAETLPGQLDHSHEVLLTAAQYKCEYPEQVHFMQSNHEMAQLIGYPIAKNGRAVIEDFNDSVSIYYGDSGGRDVLEAINSFIASFPIAIGSQNGIWMSHSLPSATEMADFDLDIFKRPLTKEDYSDHGSLFSMVWGRRHTREQLDKLAELLDVQVFITGHQPQEMGFCVLFDRLIILASDHNHGTFLPFDLSRRHTAEELIRNIRKFVAVE